MQFSPGTEDRPCLKAGTQATNRSTETIRRNPLWGEEKFWKSRIQAHFSRIGMNAVLLRTKPIIIRFKRALSRLMYKKMYCDKIESYDYGGQLLHPWQRSFPTWNSAIQGTCFSSIVPKGGRELSCDLNSPRCACLHTLTLRLCVVYAPGLVWLSYLLNARIYVCRGSTLYISYIGNCVG